MLQLLGNFLSRRLMRARLFVEMEDPEIVLDLRSLNTGQKTKYNCFWDEVEKFLQEDVGLAVEERRHSEIIYLKLFQLEISYSKLLLDVHEVHLFHLILGWLCSFAKNAHAQSGVHYTERFKVKY